MKRQESLPATTIKRNAYEKEPLFIELTGRKCEPGKTFFTVFTGGVLHNRRGYNVAMMDCDPLQYSIGPTEHTHLMTNLM